MKKLKEWIEIDEDKKQAEEKEAHAGTCNG
jgi:hypothetical protein